MKNDIKLSNPFFDFLNITRTIERNEEETKLQASLSRVSLFYNLDRECREEDSNVMKDEVLKIFNYIIDKKIDIRLKKENSFREMNAIQFKKFIQDMSTSSLYDALMDYYFYLPLNNDNIELMKELKKDVLEISNIEKEEDDFQELDFKLDIEADDFKRFNLFNATFDAYYFLTEDTRELYKKYYKYINDKEKKLTEQIQKDYPDHTVHLSVNKVSEHTNVLDIDFRRKRRQYIEFSEEKLAYFNNLIEENLREISLKRQTAEVKLIIIDGNLSFDKFKLMAAFSRKRDVFS